MRCWYSLLGSDRLAGVTGTLRTWACRGEHSSFDWSEARSLAVASVCVAVFGEHAPHSWPDCFEAFLGLGADLQRPFGDLAQDVVDHLAQGVGFVAFQEQGALRTTGDGCAGMQALDRRRLAVGQLDADGAVVSVNLNHEQKPV